MKRSNLHVLSDRLFKEVIRRLNVTNNARGRFKVYALNTVRYVYQDRFLFDINIVQKEYLKIFENFM